MCHQLGDLLDKKDLLIRLPGQSGRLFNSDSEKDDNRRSAVIDRLGRDIESWIASEILCDADMANCTKLQAFSVESERAFSAVGLFVTKLRSSLGDSTLDALLTLRSHYKSAEN